MTENEIATLDNINLENLDEAALMALTGQGNAGAAGSGSGLPRLSINYDTENDEGTVLPRGHWRLMVDGRFVYAPKLNLRPYSRMFTYSLWDQEESKFVSQSIQTGSLGDRFPDSSGGEKCGRLSKDEEKDLGQTDPRVLLSREVVCNQVIYGTVSGTAKDADKKEVILEDQPIVAYFKRSGFRPVREAIDNITRQKLLMQKTVFDLSTKKIKSGSTLTYWVPTFSQVDYLDTLTQDDMDLLKKFLDTIKAYNDGVMEKYRESTKLVADAEDISLAEELEDVTAA